MVLPPRIAPKQVVIIPIGKEENVLSLASKINQELNANDIISYIDLTDKTPGFKFVEAEVNGIHIRIEIGPRDLSNHKITFARRDTSEKYVEDIDLNFVEYVKNLLETIQNELRFE